MSETASSVIDALRILVTEDREDLRYAFSRALRGAGYEVITAANGAECLEAVSTSKPDLVLLDVILPDANGLDLCERIRSLVEPPDYLPVVLLSGVAVSGERQAQALERGADGYLVKPVDLRHLVAYVSAMLRFGSAKREAAVESQLRRAEERLRRSEERLRQAQKMEAIGQLAAGVAHDFNNLLTVVGGYSDVLLTRGRLPDQARGYVEEIQAAATRGASLTRQMLAFSRSQVLRLSSLDPNAVVAGMDKLLRRLLEENIELETRLAPDAGGVEADASQLEQVLLNLAINARDAMPNGGRLRIETEPALVEGEDGAARAFVALVVSDTGCGMDAETRERIFEPFFTTKEFGKGTGLGLATVYGIVAQLGGAVEVESEPGVGSTFRVLLPVSTQTAAAAVSAGERPTGPLAGRETVLVVEDETSVRRFISAALAQLGYRVIEAGDGVEALELARALGGRVDLLVTDAVMPRMDGATLARHLRSEWPDLGVLCMSGYAASDRSRPQLDSACASFLPKPFATAELARAVRKALDARAA